MNALGNVLHTEAKAAWLQAADCGDVNAINTLASVLSAQDQVPTAGRWRRQAAQAGHPETMHDLGYRHYQRGELAEAEHWWLTVSAPSSMAFPRTR